MGERLSDEELARINGTRWTDVNRVVTPGMQVAMAVELRQRRAADLTDEEREACSSLVYIWERRQPEHMTDREQIVLAAIRKLLAAGGAR